jgi:hypothetical protein
MAVVALSVASVVAMIIAVRTLVAILDHAAAVEPQPLRGRTEPLRAEARVLFSSATESSLTLDCALIAVEPTVDAVPVGLPFTIRLRAPQAGWFEDMTAALLSGWAVDGRIIDVEFLARRRAALDDGATKLWLDVDAVSGLDLDGRLAS